MIYSQETKSQASLLYAEGLSLVEIGRRLGVPRPTIYRWVTPKGQACYANPEARERRRRCNEVHTADPKNKERKKAYDAKPENKERRKASEEKPENKERRKEYIKAYHKMYYQRPEVVERQKEYMKRYSGTYRNGRYAADPSFRVLLLVRNRISSALRGGIKTAGTEELLGIPVLELTQRWDTDYGPDWRSQDLHIDHIRPCASFDLADPDQQRLCFNHRNLQLLSAAENMAKSDSWTPEMESAWTTRMLDLSWTGELFLTYAAAKPC